MFTDILQERGLLNNAHEDEVRELGKGQFLLYKFDVLPLTALLPDIFTIMAMMHMRLPIATLSADTTMIGDPSVI